MSCDLINLHGLLGKKWTYALLYAINDTPQTFTRIEQRFERKINPTLLSKRLQSLTKHNIILRQEKDNSVFYSTTLEGNELKTLLYNLKKLSLKLNCDIAPECKHKDCSDCNPYKEN